MSPVNIIHLGAENCVTGSCHLVRLRRQTGADINILVDCGTAYGHDPEPGFNQFPVPPGKPLVLFVKRIEFAQLFIGGAAVVLMIFYLGGLSGH